MWYAYIYIYENIFYVWVQIVHLILNGPLGLWAGIQSAGEIEKKTHKYVYREGQG